MVNEYVYCPRLAYLEWVQGEWADSAETVEGRAGHRRVDRASPNLPEAQMLEPSERLHARSITLSSKGLGLVARLDLVEVADGQALPVDYKRGKRPHIDKNAYLPERVQLCAQGLLLEEHGYDCRGGILYFIRSRERVPVEFDDALRAETQAAIEGLRNTAASGRIPPPLVDSPKCPRCSLVGICLPDEVNLLQASGDKPRPLAVARPEAVPVYIQEPGAKVAKKGDTLVVSVDGEPVSRARLIDTSQLAVFGTTYLTTPALHELMCREIPVTWYSHGGWFIGHTVGTGHKNVELRTAQYRASFNRDFCLRLAKGLIAAKITNCRTMLRRNWKSDDDSGRAIADLKGDRRAARRAEAPGELLGIEGAAAARYFRCFERMFSSEREGVTRFHFPARNRRPPSDPVNALLSFGYALLVRAVHVQLMAVGLDPYRGFYHQPRYGRPALALDLMEPFRPLIADSAVIQAINNGEVQLSDFVSAGGGVALTATGRKRFIGTFERRLSVEITHPLFGYRISYRRLLEVQSRLLGRHLLGELPEYPNFTTR